MQVPSGSCSTTWLSQILSNSVCGLVADITASVSPHVPWRPIAASDGVLAAGLASGQSNDRPVPSKGRRILTRRTIEGHGGPRRTDASRCAPAKIDLRGPLWPSIVLRVESFLADYPAAPPGRQDNTGQQAGLLGRLGFGLAPARRDAWCRRARPLRDAGGFARAAAQIIQLGAAHVAATHHGDLGDQWRVEREHALHALAIADLAHREVAVQPLVGARDAHALERLGAGALALHHLDRHTHRVAGSEVWHAAARGQAGDLVRFVSLDDVHCSGPFAACP